MHSPQLLRQGWALALTEIRSWIPSIFAHSLGREMAFYCFHLHFFNCFGEVEQVFKFYET